MPDTNVEASLDSGRGQTFSAEKKKRRRSVKRDDVVVGYCYFGRRADGSFFTTGV